MDMIRELLLLLLIFEDGYGELCSNYNTFTGYMYYTYCSGYCYGIYGFENCNDYVEYEYTKQALSIGAIIGIVIGSVVFVVILCCICVCACMNGTKSSGGRVVHPTNPNPTTITVIRMQKHELGYSAGHQTTGQYPPRTYESASHH